MKNIKKIYRIAKGVNNRFTKIDLTVIRPSIFLEKFYPHTLDEFFGDTLTDQTSNLITPDIMGQYCIEFAQGRFRRKDLLNVFKFITNYQELPHDDWRLKYLTNTLFEYFTSKRSLHDFAKGAYHLALPQNIRQSISVSNKFGIEDNDKERQQSSKSKQPIYLY